MSKIALLIVAFSAIALGVISHAQLLKDHCKKFTGCNIDHVDSGYCILYLDEQTCVDSYFTQNYRCMDSGPPTCRADCSCQCQDRGEPYGYIGSINYVDRCSGEDVLR